MSLLKKLFGHKDQASEGRPDSELTEWFAEEQAELKTAVKDAVRSHIEDLRKKYDDLYGYAILPGEPYEIKNLVAVSNRESEIKKDDAYFRFSVDEWENWDYEAFESATPILNKLNEKFRSLHDRDSDGPELARYEIDYVSSIHTVLLGALKELANEGLFDREADDGFTAIWISDSSHDIIFRSVRELNSAKVVKEFMDEFGE